MTPAPPRPLQRARRVAEVPSPSPGTSSAPALDPWRVEFPHLAETHVGAISDPRGERIKRDDFARIAQGQPRLRKGRDEIIDVLAALEKVAP